MGVILGPVGWGEVFLVDTVMGDWVEVARKITGLLGRHWESQGQEL
jgi:hypothetical protein